MLTTPLEEKLRRLVEAPLESMGYTLVQLRLTDGGKRRILQIMAERSADRGMSIDDCERISTHVSALLDVEDPVSGAYQLEVCSPGIDRPLVREDDFSRHQGFEAKVETALPIDGRKRFRGVIQGVENGEVLLDMPEGSVRIPFISIRNAKLAMTDALLAAALKGSANAPKLPDGAESLADMAEVESGASPVRRGPKPHKGKGKPQGARRKEGHHASPRRKSVADTPGRRRFKQTRDE